MSGGMFSVRRNGALASAAAIACLVVSGGCPLTPGPGGTGTTIPFGTSSIRPIQAGDSSTYNYSRIFANNSKFQGTMTEQVSSFSSATLGQGLTVTRTFAYDTFAPNGTKESSVTRTEAMSLVPVGSSTAVTDLVEVNNNGTVAQVVTPASGAVLPFYNGTLQTGQIYSYPYTLSDGTVVTATSSVLGPETITVPYGTVATLKVTSSELNDAPTGKTTFSRTAWRHPVLGVIKRVADIVDTPTGGNPNTSQETIELVSTNIAVGP